MDNESILFFLQDLSKLVEKTPIPNNIQSRLLTDFPEMIAGRSIKKYSKTLKNKSKNKNKNKGKNKNKSLKGGKIKMTPITACIYIIILIGILLVPFSYTSSYFTSLAIYPKFFYENIILKFSPGNNLASAFTYDMYSQIVKVFSGNLLAINGLFGLYNNGCKLLTIMTPEITDASKEKKLQSVSESSEIITMPSVDSFNAKTEDLVQLVKDDLDKKNETPLLLDETMNDTMDDTGDATDDTTRDEIADEIKNNELNAQYKKMIIPKNSVLLTKI
jgi:hypothetical protein